MGKNADRKKIVSLPGDTLITEDLILNLLKARITGDVQTYYEQNRGYFFNDTSLDEDKKKPNGKPDNRIKNNFAKYIVGVLNGYFLGKPIGYKSDDEDVNTWIQQNKLKSLDINLANKTSIYGHAFELVYLNRDSEVRSKAIDPTNVIYVFENTVEENELFAVYFYKTEDEKGEPLGYAGRVYTATNYNSFNVDKELSKLSLDVEIAHPFGGIPIIEYKENDERSGAFDGVLTHIDAYNKALSEKGNDVDSFADAYLKLFGVKLDDPALEHLRSNRIINVEKTDKDSIIEAEFLQKPNGDQTQENYLDRLDELIHNLSFVPNLSDKTFGQASSGILLQYKMWATETVRANKEMMFRDGLQKRFKLVTGVMGKKKGIIKRVKDLISKETESVEDLVSFTFYKNTPISSIEQVTMVKDAAGMISHETQLRLLPFIDNPAKELELMEQEKEPNNPEGSFGGLNGQTGK